MTSQQCVPFISGILPMNFKIKAACWLGINISEFAYVKNSDDIHDLPQFEIIVDLNLAFKI